MLARLCIRNFVLPEETSTREVRLDGMSIVADGDGLVMCV